LTVDHGRWLVDRGPWTIDHGKQNADGMDKKRETARETHERVR
jgi:hypothetical protein